MSDVAELVDPVDPVEAPKRLDGRVVRGMRTRASIVEALLDLITEGELSPTTAEIAERAGVSVRSLFQHFVDLESLYADLAKEQSRRVRPLFDPIDSSGDLDERIALLVAQRREFFETVAPVRRVVVVRASASPVLMERLVTATELLRGQLVDLFARELGATDDPTLLDQLDVVSSFDAWDRMRQWQDLDEQGAADLLTAILRRLLV